ncbi:MAG: DUF115 domain-containing protein [Bacteroidaceae bacterium]|nr:DUF115 domain-containing protein [Bacteroidaceae bacterium]
MGKAWQKCWNALNYLYGTLLIGSRRHLRTYKNSHNGRCFIIGNGPSLRNSDLKRLMELGEVTFACNSLIKLFNEIPFAPTYYFAQDNKIILDNKQEIADYKGIRFLKAHYANRYHIKGVTYYNMLFPQNPIGFSNNIPNVVYSGQTVTYSMIQFAAYMGFKEIYLIGVDCNYSSNNSVINKESYFDPRLFNSKRSYAAPEVNTNLLAYARAREVCDRKGVKIYNATRGGKLEIFERANLDDILKNPKNR